MTLRALEDTAKLINSIDSSSVRLPTTKVLLLKELFSISPIKPLQHFYCEKCKMYTICSFNERNKPKCKNCKKKVDKDSFVVHINLEEQLESIIDRHFDEIMEFRHSMENEAMSVKDTYNANHMTNILATNTNIWSLVMSTDGVSITKSNSSSLWPIVFICNFLPPNIRFKNENIIVGAFYHGKEKPNIIEFFRPIATEFTKLSKGIFIKDRIFKFFVTNASFDLPAKSLVSQIKQFNSYEACNYCLQTGEKTIKGVRYTYETKPVPLRNHSHIIQNISKVQKQPTKVFNGIKGMTPLISFDHFDLANSFCIDYMHQALLGVTKCLLGFWTNTQNKEQPYYISKPKRNELNKRIMQIKTPSFISRRPRSIEQIKLFKSSEFRNLLIYFLPVCLENLIPAKYIIHLQKFSSAIYKLLQKSITPEDMRNAESDLDTFVSQYQKYYGKINMTMNVHSLLHLVSCVKHFGPLWCYSMFPFEAFNGLLKSYVVAPTDILYQITIRYIGSTIFKPVEQLNNAVGFKDSINVTIDLTDFQAAFDAADICFDMPIDYFSVYEKNGTRFTSQMYSKATKTNDYIIVTENDVFGEVQFYFSNNFKQYALIQVIDQCGNIIQVKKVTFTRTYRVIKAETIIDRCIYMRFIDKDFIVRRPNPFERN